MNRAIISRENPGKVFDLIQKIGSGTYGDVYKVRVLYYVSVNVRLKNELNSSFASSLRVYVFCLVAAIFSVLSNKIRDS